MFVETVKNKMQNSNFQVSQSRREETVGRQQETQLTVIPRLLYTEHLVCARHRAKHSIVII